MVKILDWAFGDMNFFLYYNLVQLTFIVHVLKAKNWAKVMALDFPLSLTPASGSTGCLFFTLAPSLPTSWQVSLLFPVPGAGGEAESWLGEISQIPSTRLPVLDLGIDKWQPFWPVTPEGKSTVRFLEKMSVPWQKDTGKIWHFPLWLRSSFEAWNCGRHHVTARGAQGTR